MPCGDDENLAPDDCSNGRLLGLAWSRPTLPSTRTAHPLARRKPLGASSLEIGQMAVFTVVHPRIAARSITAAHLCLRDSRSEKGGLGSAPLQYAIQAAV